MSQEKSTMKDIQVANLKGVLIICIFFYHSTTALKYVTTPQWIPIEQQLAFTYCFSRVLGVFFLISGYYSIQQNYVLSFANWWNIVVHRAKRILIPYFLWNIIYIMFFCLGGIFLPSIASRVQEMNLNTCQGILGGILGVWTRPADGPIWYLRDLFYLSILSPIFYWFSQKRRRLIILVIILLGYWWASQKFILTFCHSYELTAFVLGVWMRQAKVSLHYFDNKGWIAIIFFVLFILFASNHVTYLPLLHIYKTGGEYLILIPTLLYMMKYLSYSMDTRRYIMITKPSFFIFASHALFASMVVRVFCPYFPVTPVNGILFAILYFLGGGMLIYIAYILLIKSNITISKLLMGGR